MAGRLPSPFHHWVNSAGAPYAGGSLTFYESGSSTPLDTYSDATLSTLNTNPVVLNSAGRPSVAIFLQNLPYKVVLKDSSGNEIWTADPVSATDFGSVTVTKTGSGDPNGVMAGTAGSSGVLADEYWDYTNLVLYRCTTTGTAATAVWTAINAQAATPVVSPPQGYLTPTSGTPIILSDSTSATAVYYTPFTGNLVPIYNGSRMVPTEFTELTLTLHSSHTATAIYDVFVFSNDGVLTLVTGPAWVAGSRPSGAGTTEIDRLKGYWVNAVSITGRNGSDTYTIGANLATYLGSIYIDSSNGQVTCHRSYGQSRKWGIWNAYNRQPLYLKAGDSTASWTYDSTIRSSNAAAANSLIVFQGLVEECYHLAFTQRITISGDQADSTATIGIGFNSTSAMSGKVGKLRHNLDTAGSNSEMGADAKAAFLTTPVLGIRTISALEIGSTSGGTITFFGGEDDMLLTARWRG